MWYTRAVFIANKYVCHTTTQAQSGSNLPKYVPYWVLSIDTKAQLYTADLTKT